MAASLLGAGLSPVESMAALARFAGGAVMAMALTSLSTQIQEGLPEEVPGTSHGRLCLRVPRVAAHRGDDQRFRIRPHLPPVAFAMVAAVLLRVAL